MTPDWDHIRIFLAVARSGQLLAASRRLQLDHATVGRRIDALEATVGVKLLERGPAGSSLTAAGERLLATAERIESDIFGALAEFSQSEASISGVVRVGAPDGFGSYFLLPRLARFAALYPELVIQFVPLPRTFSLSRREADIAITIDPPKEGRLVVRKLSDYGLGLYAAHAHLEAQGQIHKIEDLTDRTLITYVPDLMYSASLDYAGDLERIAKRRFECASVIAQVEAVRSGLGVGILHDYAARQDPDLIRILPSFAVRRSYWIVTHKDQRALRRIQAVHDFITSEVKKNRGIF